MSTHFKFKTAIQFKTEDSCFQSLLAPASFLSSDLLALTDGASPSSILSSLLGDSLMLPPIKPWGHTAAQLPESFRSGCCCCCWLRAAASSAASSSIESTGRLSPRGTPTATCTAFRPSRFAAFSFCTSVQTGWAPPVVSGYSGSTWAPNRPKDASRHPLRASKRGASVASSACTFLWMDNQINATRGYPRGRAPGGDFRIKACSKTPPMSSTSYIHPL